MYQFPVEKCWPTPVDVSLETQSTIAGVATQTGQTTVNVWLIALSGSENPQLAAKAVRSTSLPIPPTTTSLTQLQELSVMPFYKPNRYGSSSHPTC